jgi:catechol 2,3-dioxygenase-like lactoylglutathione lyase family enzyme
MRIARGHHVSFAVRELARARHFYGSVLGLREIERPALGIAGAWYAAGDTEVHLIEAPAGVDTGAPPPRLTPIADHAAFAIDDYDAAVAHLRGAGLAVLETRREIGQLWVQDPDGHVIELIVPRPR